MIDHLFVLIGGWHGFFYLIAIYAGLVVAPVVWGVLLYDRLTGGGSQRWSDEMFDEP